MKYIDEGSPFQHNQRIHGQVRKTWLAAVSEGGGRIIEAQFWGEAGSEFFWQDREDNIHSLTTVDWFSKMAAACHEHRKAYGELADAHEIADYLLTKGVRSLEEEEADRNSPNYY